MLSKNSSCHPDKQTKACLLLTDRLFTMCLRNLFQKAHSNRVFFREAKKAFVCLGISNYQDHRKVILPPRHDRTSSIFWSVSFTFLPPPGSAQSGHNPGMKTIKSLLIQSYVYYICINNSVMGKIIEVKKSVSRSQVDNEIERITAKKRKFNLRKYMGEVRQGI